VTYTEHDLRRALAASEATAVDPVRLLHDVNRRVVGRRRRRRAGLAGGLVLAVAATVAATVAALSATVAPPGGDPVGGRPAATAATAATRAPFSFTLRPFRADGFIVSPAEVAPGWQRASVLGPDLKAGAELRLFEPGGFDPARHRRNGRVDVAGRPGHLSVRAVELDGQRGGYVELAWEYRPGQWGELTGWLAGDDGGRDAALRIAAAVPAALDEPLPARSPFTLAHRPAGMRTTQVGVDQPVSIVTFAGAVPGSDAPMAVEVVPASLTGAWSPTTTFAGRPARREGELTTVDYPELGLRLRIRAPARMDAGELERIVLGLTPAGLDRSAWPAAADALPVG
jgi:hypothetical protein